SPVWAGPIDYLNFRLPNVAADFPKLTWSPEAQAAMNALPAFVRAPCSYVLANLVGTSGRAEVTLEDVHRLFREYYHSTPEPLKSWALLSIKGPLDFAIANHPDAAGGYSIRALVLPGRSDTIADLSHPDHLYLLNHGYRAGLDFIRSDFGKSFANLGRKLVNFSDGVSLGYGAYNLPSVGP